MLLENAFQSPFKIRGAYDNSEQYYVGDIVSHTISNVTRAFVLMTDAVVGTAPTLNSVNWSVLVDEIITATGPQGLAAPKTRVQYSADGSTWRSNYTEGDPYKRESFDGGRTWTDPILFRGEQGDSGNNIRRQFSNTGADGETGTFTDTAQNYARDRIGESDWGDWYRRTTTEIATHLPIYRRSPTQPAPPSGGSWDGVDFTLPDGWQRTDPDGDDRLYMVIVALSADGGNSITYGPLINCGIIYKSSFGGTV